MTSFSQLLGRSMRASLRKIGLLGPLGAVLASSGGLCVFQRNPSAEKDEEQSWYLYSSLPLLAIGISAFLAGP